jgi:hypothetical protein
MVFPSYGINSTYQINGKKGTTNKFSIKSETVVDHQSGAVGIFIDLWWYPRGNIFGFFEFAFFHFKIF